MWFIFSMLFFDPLSSKQVIFYEILQKSDSFYWLISIYILLSLLILLFINFFILHFYCIFFLKKYIYHFNILCFSYTCILCHIFHKY